MKRSASLIAVLALAAMPAPAEAPGSEDVAERRARILAPATDFSAPEPFETLQGGTGTSTARPGRNAFSLPSAALSFEARADFFVGNGVFDRPWVVAPSSTVSSDGLGPLFDARSCQGCHVKDGRGRPPGASQPPHVSTVFALADAAGAPDPVLGRQLSDQAIPGGEAEGRVQTTWVEVPFRYPDGAAASLRRPVHEADAPLAQGVAVAARMAPPMIGLGLLEAVPEADLAAAADPDDADGDGISGRLALGPEGVGRFGWKASSPTIEHQAATAFSLDMGLSTRLFPADWGDCTAAQTACLSAFHGGDAGRPEVADALLNLVTFYAAHLAVPARRDVGDPDVLAGKALFYDAGCTGCHTPKLATARGAPDGLGGQLIWPYTDLLLHDMGPGLADANPSMGAGAGEWRTPPLWGIGLTETVGGQAHFLHDGRARTLEEAILWHGGEGAAARDAFAAAPAERRAALIRFLESL